MDSHVCRSNLDRLLYYFNFVQTEYFKETSPEGKSAAISKLVPRALWWFRYGALFTFLSGTILAAYLGGAINYYITLGMIMGTLMFLNVWLIIWPNQKIVIASNEQVLGGGEALPDAASALGKAGLASRTNTLFHYRCFSLWALLGILMVSDVYLCPQMKESAPWP